MSDPLSQATEGYFGGGSSGGGGGGGIPPVIAAISPTPGVLPGQAGGFPANFTSAADTAVVVSVTGTSALTYINVTEIRPDGGSEIVYRAGNFVSPYALLSWAVAVAGGFELHVMRYGGWLPADLVTDPSFVRLLIDAVDVDGNSTSADLVWTLPAAVTATARTSTVVSTTIDHVAEALARLPEQFKNL